MRGLGQKQLAERLLTDSKIVAFLERQPHTFESLRRVTHIQRNTLKKRLNYLVSRKIIIKHHYLKPYRSRYLANLYNRDWYLLDLEHTEAEMLREYYYENEPEYKKFQESKRKITESDLDSKIIELRRNETEIIAELKAADDKATDSLSKFLLEHKDTFAPISPYELLVWNHLQKPFSEFVGYQTMFRAMNSAGLIQCI